MKVVKWIFWISLFGLYLVSCCFGDEIYEKNGVTYIIGSPTKEQKEAFLTNYNIRMNKRQLQIEAELQREHEQTIESIKAQAMKDYLLAQSLAYGNATASSDSINVYTKSYGGNIGNITADGGKINNNIEAKGGEGGISNSNSTSTVGNIKTTARNNNTNYSTNYNLNY